MKWNLFLAVISLVVLVLFAGVGIMEHLTQAEAIADELAPQIDVNHESLREHLEELLERGRVRRVFVYCTPWAIMTALLFARLVVDARKQRNGHK